MKPRRAVEPVSIEQRHRRAVEFSAYRYQLFRKRRAFEKAEGGSGVEFDVVFVHCQSGGGGGGGGGGGLKQTFGRLLNPNQLLCGVVGGILTRPSAFFCLPFHLSSFPFMQCQSYHTSTKPTTLRKSHTWDRAFPSPAKLQNQHRSVPPVASPTVPRPTNHLEVRHGPASRWTCWYASTGLASALDSEPPALWGNDFSRNGGRETL